MESTNKLSQLQSILQKASVQGVDVKDLLRKVDSAMTNSNSKTIKIVLMGAFSDGKTTVIAGVTGRLESDMKIAIDESSDQLTFYHLPALGYDFEIVDTPGLFGTKEREIEGRNARYSDITREYISQAHIVIYVTNASNPLKDSHAGILKYTLRDLGKLSNTIFVINKMDDAGYELTDEEDFARGEKIKKATFISRLNQVVQLAENEKNNLNIVCIAANPNGRGLDFWFKYKDRYMSRSRIDSLGKVIKKIATSADKNKLMKNVEDGTIKDLALQTATQINRHKNMMESEVDKLKQTVESTRHNLVKYRSTAICNKGLLHEALANKQSEIESAVNNATMDDFGTIINKYIGEKGERLERTINQIFSEYAERNKVAFEKSNIRQDFEKMSDLTHGLMKTTSNIMKNTKIGADTIKGIRDVVASGFKFRPWQAVNWGKFLTKALVWIGVAIDLFMSYKKWKEKQKFEQAKKDTKKAIGECFSNAEQYLKTEQIYFDNFAPGIKVTQTEIDNITTNIEQYKNVVRILSELHSKLIQWCGSTTPSYGSSVNY